MVREQNFIHLDDVDWNNSVSIELIGKDATYKLDILDVEWGTSSILIFYTNNPFGEISQNGYNDLPMLKPFSRRLLINLEDLDMKVNFNMKK